MQSEKWVRATKVVVVLAVVVAVVGVLFALMGSGMRKVKYRSDIPARYGAIEQDSGISAPGLMRSGGEQVAPVAVSASPDQSASKAFTYSESSLASDESSVPAEEKKVIRNGSMTVRVENADWTAQEIGRIAQDAGGDVASSDISDNGNGIKSGVVTIKVAADKLNQAMEKIKSLARATFNESVSAQDATMQYTDLQARLKNKQSEEAAFAAILERQTDKIQDVLATTRELARVRGEIEQLQAQIKYLESQTDMATITVFLSEDPQLGKTVAWRPWQVVKDAFNTLIQNAQGLVDFLIRLVIVVLPILLIVFIIFGALLWWVAKKVNQWWKNAKGGE